MKQPELLLPIGGFTPFSSVDYPDKLAAVVFCQGCPWRCRYCHNPDLLPTHRTQEIFWVDVLKFLTNRHGLLDAVVFSGGEPTLQPNLGAAIQQAAALGFKVGLHTSGYAPERLTQLFPLVDWIGLDIKTLAYNYRYVTGAAESGVAAWASAKLVINSGIAYEIRTTLHPALLPLSVLENVLLDLKQMGATNIVVQRCRTETVFDPNLQNIQVSMEPYRMLLRSLNVAVRE